MDINTVRGLSTFLVMGAFLAICWWAYGARRKERFDEASQLPFKDDDIAERTVKETEKNNHE
ncbi:MAG: CcoQ/FixQ family Cbb3-type cytochrome c oxidase assembly chaperone [Gammaproteobacteria bacterium]|nr:MAG: CcoQ/FixQ family Cbb3-type cytochrome c oxidase assembly chaperone [Gammaproteobacteria bacterium]